MTCSEKKENIKNALQDFAEGDLTENAIKFFHTLDYNTERTVHLNRPDLDNFISEYATGTISIFENGLAMHWKYVDLLFQLTGYEIGNQLSLFENEQVNFPIQSYLFFIIELIYDDYSPSILKQITRYFNGKFPIPVMLIFKHGDNLSFSIVDRRFNKKDNSRDVLEKVTLLSGVSISNPKQSHIDLLNDISQNKIISDYRISNFSKLHYAWADIFSLAENDLDEAGNLRFKPLTYRQSDLITPNQMQSIFPNETFANYAKPYYYKEGVFEPDVMLTRQIFGPWTLPYRKRKKSSSIKDASLEVATKKQKKEYVFDKAKYLSNYKKLKVEQAKADTSGKEKSENDKPWYLCLEDTLQTV